MLENLLWKRALEGKPTVCLGGQLPAAPPVPHITMRIDCAAWSRPLGPMLELQRELERLIEMPRSDHEDAAASLAHVINRLQRQMDAPLVILIENVHLADEMSLELMGRLLGNSPPLTAAVILHSQRDRLEGAPAMLVERVVAAYGDEALVRAPTPAESETAVESHAIAEILPEVRRVLRVGALIGDTFEAQLAAGVLMLDGFTTLELLQMAIDGGVEVEDCGSGIFRLDAKLAEALRRSTIPSLASAWHGELAEILAAAQEPAADEGPSVDEHDDVARSREDLLEALNDKWRGRDLASRSAEHAEAAGERPAAALRYVVGAEEASRIGGHLRAQELVLRAETSLNGIDDAATRRTMARVLLAKGRVLWRAAGVLPQVKLADALEPLVRALTLTTAALDPATYADICTQLARVAYDIGDEAHMRLALDTLRECREMLFHAGRVLDAARLFNEEAAALIRVGELGAASELLARSREVFARHADESVDARRELAQTNALVARLPLHGELRPGDAPAVAFSLECAHSASRIYADLDDAWEHARTQETIGRLRHLQGRHDEAKSLFRAAAARQQELGDAMGLARTTGALATLLAAAGAHDDALQVLGDSVQLNLQLGSKQGVRYNLDALAEFERSAPPALRDAITELVTRLQPHA